MNRKRISDALEIVGVLSAAGGAFVLFGVGWFLVVLGGLLVALGFAIGGD